MESNIKEINNFIQTENKEKRLINIIRRKENKNLFRITTLNKTILRKKAFENNIQLENYLIIIKLFISMNLLIQILSSTKPHFIDSNIANITLKIKGIGPKNIFGQQFFEYTYYPKEIYINGEKQDEIKKTYYFNETINSVELFWNRSITFCGGMFYGCSDITEFDFSNFDTSKVQYMGFMFCNCSSLISLNLSTFITTNVLSMRCMFNGCSLLTSLNLSNFYTPKLNMNYQMFDGCTKLKYINIKNFEETRINNNTADYRNIFNGVPDNVVICINENNTKNKIFPQLKNKTIDCFDDWECKYEGICNKNCQYYYYLNENNESFCTENETCYGIYDKLIIEKNECVNICQFDSIYKYEYNNICYNKCPNGTIYDENEKKCFDEKNIQTTFITTEIFKSHLNSIKSTSIDINFSSFLNESNTLIPSGQINLTTTSFFDNNIFNTSLFSTHLNVTSIVSTYLNNEIIKNEKNTSFINIIQESTFPPENISQSFIENLQSSFNQVDNTQKVKLIIEGNNEEIYKEVINKIILNFDFNEEKEMIFQGEDGFFFHITTSQNELETLKRNNNSNKFSIIDLGECEHLLKKHYQIYENASLLILKYEKISNISTERSLQYEVYEPFNKTKLDLSKYYM